MDHLPCVKDPVYPLLEIPVVFSAEDEYDYKGFAGFPARRGFDKTLLLKGDRHGQSAERTASFLQSWLYFGLLVEVMGVSDVVVDINDFIIAYDKDGQSLRLVTTRLFPIHIQKWKEQELSYSQEVQMEHFQTISDLIGEARAVFAKFANFRSLKLGLGPLDQIVSLSMAIMGESLCYSWAEISDRLFRLQSEEDQGQILSSWEVNPFPLMKMEEAGWCESDRANMCSGGQTITFFASMLARPWMRQGHGRCTVTDCAEHRTYEGDYKQKHVLDCPGCKGMLVDQQELGCILQDGTIPRVIIEDKGDGISLTLASTGPYVAISHVWSHGLGNPVDNSLPHCQLSLLRDRLAKLAGETSNLNSDVAMWMDTLCVPIDKQLRKLALVMMGRTFSEAHQVLVLDEELERTSIQASPAEINVRVAVSGWMRRLWTLEEAVLSRTLYIQFHDGVYQHRWSSNGGSEIFGLWNRSQFGLRALGLARKSDSSMAKQLRSVVLTLRRRSTSRQEDETICLAALFGLEVTDLIDTPPNRRMITFLRAFDEIPAPWIFHAGSPINEPGLRWAPISLLSTLFVSSMEGTAQVTPDGIFAEYPALMMGEPLQRAKNNSFLLRHLNDDSSYIVRHWHSSSIALNHVKSEAREEDHNIVPINRPAIILDSYGIRPWWTFAVLVSITRDCTDSNTFLAAVVCKVELRPRHEEEDFAQELIAEYAVATCRSLPARTRWCLS